MNSNTVRPNILLIMSDQHNPHVTGFEGNRICRTPNLDRLAREGISFRNNYCPYPLCVPSRMAFLAGRYASSIDVWDNGSTLSPAVPTFAHALAASGYETVLCGRMHLRLPSRHYGFLQRIYGDCETFVTRTIIGSGYYRTNGQTKYAAQVSGYGKSGFEYYDSQVTEQACRFLSETSESDDPYCLVVGFMLPHNPLICSQDLFEHYLHELPRPTLMSDDEKDTLSPPILAWMKRRGVFDITAEQWHRSRAAYYGLVETMDGNVGRILSALDCSAAKNNTIVIYTSDHGDMCGEHGMWWKSNHYDGSARVPLIFRSSTASSKGTVVDSVTSLIDICPTLLDICGAQEPGDIQGKSLRDFLLENREPTGWTNERFCEYIGAHGDKPSSMVRSDQWKLMYYPEFDRCLLFDLDSDPGETVDLSTQPQYQGIRAELLGKIEARWSAEHMLEENQRARRNWEIILKSGALFSERPVPPVIPPDANQFDFAQVPGWDRIEAEISERSR